MDHPKRHTTNGAAGSTLLRPQHQSEASLTLCDDGRVLTAEEQRLKRKKIGLCPDCGVVKTHKPGLWKSMMPQTVDGLVYKGVCLKCHNIDAVKLRRGEPLEGPSKENSMGRDHPRSVSDPVDQLAIQNQEDKLHRAKSEPRGQFASKVGEFSSNLKRAASANVSSNQQQQSQKSSSLLQSQGNDKSTMLSRGPSRDGIFRSGLNSSMPARNASEVLKLVSEEGEGMGGGESNNNDDTHQKGISEGGQKRQERNARQVSSSMTALNSIDETPMDDAAPSTRRKTIDYVDFPDADDVKVVVEEDTGIMPAEDNTREEEKMAAEEDEDSVASSVSSECSLLPTDEDEDDASEINSVDSSSSSSSSSSDASSIADSFLGIVDEGMDITDKDCSDGEDGVTDDNNELLVGDEESAELEETPARGTVTSQEEDFEILRKLGESTERNSGDDRSGRCRIRGNTIGTTRPSTEAPSKIIGATADENFEERLRRKLESEGGNTNVGAQGGERPRRGASASIWTSTPSTNNAPANSQGDTFEERLRRKLESEGGGNGGNNNSASSPGAQKRVGQSSICTSTPSNQTPGVTQETFVDHGKKGEKKDAAVPCGNETVTTAGLSSQSSSSMDRKFVEAGKQNAVSMDRRGTLMSHTSSIGEDSILRQKLDANQSGSQTARIWHRQSTADSGVSHTSSIGDDSLLRRKLEANQSGNNNARSMARQGTQGNGVSHTSSVGSDSLLQRKLDGHSNGRDEESKSDGGESNTSASFTLSSRRNTPPRPRLDAPPIVETVYSDDSDSDFEEGLPLITATLVTEDDTPVFDAVQVPDDNSPGEKERGIRIKMGSCPNCGIQTHKITGLIKKKHRCLICNPIVKGNETLISKWDALSVSSDHSSEPDVRGEPPDDHPADQAMANRVSWDCLPALAAAVEEAEKGSATTLNNFDSPESQAKQGIDTTNHSWLTNDDDGTGSSGIEIGKVASDINSAGANDDVSPPAENHTAPISSKQREVNKQRRKLFRNVKQANAEKKSYQHNGSSMSASSSHQASIREALLKHSSLREVRPEEQFHDDSTTDSSDNGSSSHGSAISPDLQVFEPLVSRSMNTGKKVETLYHTSSMATNTWEQGSISTKSIKSSSDVIKPSRSTGDLEEIESYHVQNHSSDAIKETVHDFRCRDSSGKYGFYSGTMNEHDEPHGKGEMVWDSGKITRGIWSNAFLIVKEGEDKDYEPISMPNYKIGDIVLSRDIANQTREKSMVAASKLRVGDCAFIIRSKGSYTYAVVKSRSDLEDVSITFQVNSRGCTKTFKILQWEGIKLPRSPDVLPFWELGDIGGSQEMVIDFKGCTADNVSRLRKSDAAFVRRSDGSWRYSIVTKRSHDECGKTITFQVDSIGSFKVATESIWGIHVRCIKKTKEHNTDDLTKNEMKCYLQIIRKAQAFLRVRHDHDGLSLD